MATKYFSVAFASGGERDTVPDDATVDGSVSYSVGYGYDYERDTTPGEDDLAKSIERTKFNELLYQVTSVLKQLQESGAAPDWQTEIAATAAKYPRNARVTYGGSIWTSIQDANGDTPGASSKWVNSLITDPTILAMAALTPVANQLIYFTGTDTASVASLTSLGRSLIAAANASAAQTVLGIGSADSDTAGLIREATQTEVNTGAGVSAAVLPSQIRSGFSYSAGNYWYAPDFLGGLKLGFKQVTLGAGSTTSLHTMPNSVLGVLALPNWNGSDSITQPTYYVVGKTSWLRNQDNNTVNFFTVTVGT